MPRLHAFRLLFRLFQGRFFESDDAAPGSGFQTNITQVIGFLCASGFIVAYMMVPAFSYIVNSNRGRPPMWALRGFQLFPAAYTFGVIGFAVFFEWDMLFPNRRDFLILAAFPIRLRDVFAAQLAALGKFVALLILAVNVFPLLTLTLLSFSARYRGTGVRMLAAEVAATVGVSAFAFFGVAALQGVLLNLTPPRLFRRISPYVQMAGMSAMVLSILTYPLYRDLLRPAMVARSSWLWLFPPIWFTGLHDLFLPGARGLFADLGRHALRMLGIVITVFSATWAVGFRRHYRRTLEAEEVTPRPGASEGGPARWGNSPEERAIYRFSGQTLFRSQKHRLFLATYMSVGIALATNTALTVRDGRLAVSEDGARAFPFLVLFFVISGFRAVFQFPAELASNWLVRITESKWSETSRRATRKRVLITGLLPFVLLLLPLEAAIAGWRAPLHAGLQLAAGSLLIELMFWSFDKVPFTCSYFPDRTNLYALFVFYLYGYTLYSSHMAAVEAAAEARPLIGVLVFAAAAVLLIFSWRRRVPASAARFDAAEPVIQTLDLT